MTDNGKKVSELWWEEGDMHVIFANGTHMVYKGAWVVSHEHGEMVDEDGNVIATTEKLEFDGVKSSKE